MFWKRSALITGLSIGNLFGAVSVGAQSIQGQFFVSPTGSDAYSCTKYLAPCRTLAGIRDKLRAAIAAPGGKNRNWTVILRGGRYDLPTHLVLDNRDGVNDGYVVTWKEYPGDTVKVSGGRQITGWVVGGDGRWRVTLPDVKSGAWFFPDLWINSQHSPWPIRPRRKIEDVFDMAFAVSSTGSSADDKVKSGAWDLWDGDSLGSNRFGFRTGELSASWTNLTDVRIAANDTFYYTTHYRLASVDGVNKIATMQNHMFRDLKLPATVRKWHRENVFEDLSDPGEHYLNRLTGVLTYIPRPGETPESAVVIAGYLPRLIEIRNDGTANLTRNITFSGLHFSYTNDPYSKEGWTGVTSNPTHLEGGAITVQAATRIRFERSIFEHLGQSAIRLGRAAKGITIDGVVGYDLGGGLVSAGSESRCPIDIAEHWPSYDPVVQCPRFTVDHKDVGGHVIKNFVVHDFAKKRTESPAIGIWRGSNNLVSHGEVYDGPTIGIQVGRTVNCSEFGNNINNHVEYNHIHDLGYNRKWWSWDYAGLYSIGPNEGSLWDHNYVHHIYGSNAVPNYEARGFYADNCSVGKTFTNNVVFMTDESAIAITDGSGIVIRNNLFVRPLQDYIRTGGQNGGSAPVLTFERNVVYADSVAPTPWCSLSTLICAYSGATIVENNGVYYRKQGPLTRATLSSTIAQWIASGSPLGPQSQNTSWNVDPLLIDPNNPRLGLKAGSPAFAKGFKQIDLSTIGPIGPVGAP
jgi:hypothetical protein